MNCLIIRFDRFFVLSGKIKTFVFLTNEQKIVISNKPSIESLSINNSNHQEDCYFSQNDQIEEIIPELVQENTFISKTIIDNKITVYLKED